MDITATPWRRYGHDRLYLSTFEGEKLGWIDNKTGLLTVLISEHTAVLEDWARAHRSTAISTATATPAIKVTNAFTAQPASVAAPADTTPIEVRELSSVLAKPRAAARAPRIDAAAAPAARANWTDLANNLPGQGVRNEAEKQLQAMKEKSRFLTAFARVLDINNRERSWRLGADGEETTGGRLDRLTAHGWHVLHSVPMGTRGTDIDHVLIGPAGVFCINTKNHPGKSIEITADRLKIGGNTVDYYKKSRVEAERATKILSTAVGWPVEVRPVLILLNGTRQPSVKTTSMPVDILILNRADIPKTFNSALPRLTPQAIEEIYTMARRSTTWATI
jgi:hypothetical protein